MVLNIKCSSKVLKYRFWVIMRPWSCCCTAERCLNTEPLLTARRLSVPLSVCGCPPCLKCDTRTHRHTCTVCLNWVSVCHSDSVWAVRNEVTGAVWDLQLELLSNTTFTLRTKSFKPQPWGLCSEISASEDLQYGRAWYHLLSVRCEQLYRFMVTTNQSIPLLKRGLSRFLWHSGQLIYQCLISCFGHSQLLLFCLLPSLTSLGIYSLSLSLSVH